MPCTNVVLRIAGLSVDEKLLAAAKALAESFGVRVLDYVRVANGALVGGGGAVLDARRWVLAAAALEVAKAQGFRASATMKNGKLVIAGVSQ